jgi:hypothetical protein
MSSFSGFDMSVLGSVLAAQYGYAPGASTPAAGTSRTATNRPLSAIELAKLPPWDSRQPKVAQAAEVRKILAAKSILDPGAASLKNGRLSVESDIKKLFTVHKAMDRLQTLSEAAARNGISGSEKKKLTDRFNRGMKELDEFMTRMKMHKVDLIKGRRNDKLETEQFKAAAGVLQGQNLDVSGPTVAVADFANAPPFDMTVTTEAGATTLTFDFDEMGTTIRSLDNVAGYMNSKLAAEGFGTRVRSEYKLDLNTGTYGWGLTIQRATGEDVTFPGSPGSNGPVPGGNLIVNGDFRDNPLPSTAPYGDLGSLNGWTSNNDFELFNVGERGWAIDTDIAYAATPDEQSQSVQTEAGKLYDLTFDYKTAQDSWTPTTDDFDVLWNGNVVGTFSPDGKVDWLGGKVQVTGTGGMDTLTFREKGENDAGGSLVANVRLQEAMGTSPPPPPVSVGTNLLQDGSFENPNVASGAFATFTSNGAWTSTGPGFQVIDRTGSGVATQGNQLLELGGQDVSQSVNTVAGQSYRLSFDFMDSDSGGPNGARFQVLWNGSVVADINPESGDQDWETRQINVTGTGGSDTVTFRRMDTTNNLDGAWLDNISLQANPTPTGANLVGNGSFESGLTGWTQSGIGLVNDATRASNGTQTTMMSSANNGAGWSMSTNVSGTAAGQAYALEFDYGSFGTVGAGPESGVRAIVKDAGGNVLASRDFYDSTQQNTGAGIYQKGRLDFGATGANVTVEFVDINSGNAITDTTMLDNVSVRAIPGAVSPPPPPPTGNILVNGSFEATDIATDTWAAVNTPGWTGITNSTLEIQEFSWAPASAGAQNAELSNGGFKQTVNTQAGQNYQLSFAAQHSSDGSTYENSFEVWWNGSKVGDVNPVLGGGWNTTTLNLAGTGGAADLEFRMKAGAFEGAMIDNVQMVATGAASPGLTSPPPGTEMLVNGSFNSFSNQLVEYGPHSDLYQNVTGWTSTADSNSGVANNAFEVVYTTGSSRTNAIDLDMETVAAADTITQAVQTEAGRTYDLSFTYETTTGAITNGGNSAGFEVLWNGAVVGTFNPTDTSVQTRNLQVLGTGGQDSLSFREIGNNDGYGAILSDVSLKAGASVGGSSPAPNLLSGKGDFANPDLGQNSFTHFNGSAGGWTTTNRIEIQQNGTGGAGTGTGDDQYMELDGNISTTMQTQAGQAYNIAFDFMKGNDGSALDQQFEVVFNGNVVGTFDGNNVNSWQNGNVSVTGTGGTDTLTFRKMGSTTPWEGAFIDSVTMTAANGVSPPAVPAQGTNILVNGDFEADNVASGSVQTMTPTAWAQSGAQQQFHVYDTFGGAPAASGSQYGELATNALQQSVATQAGRSYTIEFDSRFGNDGNVASNAFEVLWNGQVVSTVSPAQGDQTWRQTSVNVTGTGGNDTLMFRRVTGSSLDAAWIDDVKVIAGAAVAPELVTNGGFEADNIATGSFSFQNVTGWTGITGSTGELRDESTSPQGQQNLELMNGGTRQSINTEAGKIYELNFASRAGWDGNAASHAFEVWYNGQMIADMAPQQGQSWRNSTFTFRGAGGPANLEFRMKPGQENAQGAMIDAVSVREALPGSSPNLLRNGSFEANDQATGDYIYLDAPLGWTASNPGVNEVADTWEGVPGTDGTQWMEFSSNTLSQAVTTQVGQAYTFSFDYRGGDAGTGDQQRFRVRVNGVLVDQVDANGVNNWASESYTFIGSGNDTVQFERLSGGKDTGIWLDNVAVRAQTVTPPPPPTVGPNIVTNGSFETDNVATGSYTYLLAPAGWTASNAGVNEVADTWNGIPGSDGPQWMEFSSTTLSQALTTQAGQNYTFSFDYRGGDAGTGDQQRFRVRVNGQLLDQVDANGINNWASKAYTFTASGNDTIQFERLSGGKDTGVWLDNVQVLAHAPPAGPVAAGTDIITNGSFEATNVANNSSADVTQAGWTTVLGTNGGRVDTLDYSGAPDGRQYAELDQAGGYKTTLNTELGRTYTLDFDFKNNANGSVADNQFEVWWNGSKIGEYGPGAGQGWTNGQLSVVGTGGAASLEFRTRTNTLGMSNFNGAHIDDVKMIAGAAPSTSSGSSWGSNMLANGSFENYGGAGGWANNSVNMASTEVAGFFGQLAGWSGNSAGGTGSGGDLIRGTGGAPLGTDGNVVVELDGVGGPNVDGLSQSVQTTAGTQYRLQFDLSRYNNVANSSSQVEVVWNGQVVGTATPSGINGEWKTATFLVNGTGGNDTFQLREVGAQNDGGGALIDNVRLQANLATLPPQALGANLVNNGSFEITPAPVAEGNLGIWSSIQGWSTRPGDSMEVVNPLNGGGENASNGNYFLELDTDNVTQTEISQGITTEAGKSYQISVDHKARQSYTGSATNGIEVLWNGAIVGDISATDWQNWTTSTFNVTATGTTSQLMFREKGGNGDGFGAHMDNVKVQERIGVSGTPLGPPSADMASRTYGTSLIQDGGFEGLARSLTSSLAQSAWQTADGDAEVWGTATLASFPGNGSTTAEGSKFIELDQYGRVHNDFTRDEISQDVQTEAGKVYQLDFNSMGRYGGGAVSNTLEVLWNDEVIGTVTSDADGVWDTSRFDVIGTGGVDRLAFRETEGGNDASGPFIDNVRLREVTNAPVDNPNDGPDILGMTGANWGTGGSMRVVDMTSAKAGDKFSMIVNDKKEKTFTITNSMTLRELAAQVQREMGSAGTASVVMGPKGWRIDMDPKQGNRIQVFAGSVKGNALDDLGLPEGVARKIGTSKDSKRPAFVSGIAGGQTVSRGDGVNGIFRGAKGINAKAIAALDFDPTLKIDDKTTAKAATDALESSMRKVRLAYRQVNGELDAQTSGLPKAVFSPREAARMAQYQDALTKLQGGPTTSMLLGGF